MIVTVLTQPLPCVQLDNSELIFFNKNYKHNVLFYLEFYIFILIMYDFLLPYSYCDFKKNSK